MKGKIPEIAGSHVSSRVLQVCFCIFEFYGKGCQIPKNIYLTNIGLLFSPVT